MPTLASFAANVKGTLSRAHFFPAGHEKTTKATKTPTQRRIAFM
jgi:hypothetical protein